MAADIGNRLDTQVQVKRVDRHWIKPKLDLRKLIDIDMDVGKLIDVDVEGARNAGNSNRTDGAQRPANISRNRAIARTGNIVTSRDGYAHASPFGLQTPIMPPSGGPVNSLLRGSFFGYYFKLKPSAAMRPRILLANPRGFCAGVEMAVESLDLALERFGAPVYVYHFIVHNRIIVEGFERRGAVFTNELARIPKGAHVLFSAHGVSPEIRTASQELNLRVVDATCPLVTKVHREVREFARQGYTTLLIGHAGHDEVVGILGEADGIVLIENVNQAERVRVPDAEKVAYTTQTTLSLDDCNAIIKTLRVRFPKLRGPLADDICYATQNRQRAVQALARMADAALIIGSRNSSNTMRLVEIAEAAGIPAYRIDVPDEINPEWFRRTRTLLLTSGASAPEVLVKDTIARLKTELGATCEEQPGKRELVHFPLPQGLGPP